MSVTDVDGFSAAGIASGIKQSGDTDLALIVTADARPVPAAGVFTSNKMTAAPVIVSREHLNATAGHAAAVIVNSGNANAATGRRGLEDAVRMCGDTADAVGCPAEEVLVCSTGLIGYHLPMDVITAGIPKVAAAVTPDGGPTAARAIMTTDTVAKTTLISGDGFRIGGIAKGAAMLEPNMATMLAILTTDHAARSQDLRASLRRAVAASFNRLTVDGAESTNDTVLVLANGRSGVTDLDQLDVALTAACRDLAFQMANDAEGSTKTVILTVTGALSNAEAASAARDCANCQLVKCSWYGEDPYWGRIASEFGAAGIGFDPNRLTIAYGDHVVYRHGEPAGPASEELIAYMKRRTLALNVDLGLGSGAAEIITNDLTHAYVDENMGTS